MAPITRGKKNLVCFYCNRTSSIKFDGFITCWDCAQCGSSNFLDENGEITDPPVATEDAGPPPSNAIYTLPRSSSAKALSEIPEPEVFCSTCLKNQQIFTSLLRDFDAIDDPADPEYRKREKEFYEHRNKLERLYPQVCEDCEPRVLRRMRAAEKTAKTDYLRRLLDESRARRVHRAKPWSLMAYLMFAGKLLWYCGLLGQFLWSISTLFASALHSSSAISSILPTSSLKHIELATSIATSDQWARTSLYFSIASFWWNPLLAETSRGFRRHISGEGEWYKFQALMVASRSIFFSVTGTGVFANPFSQATVGGHIFMFLFIAMVAFKTRRSLKIEMGSLWANTPERLRGIVGPRGNDSTRGPGSMSDVLSSIAAESSNPRPNPIILSQANSPTSQQQRFPDPQSQTRHQNSSIPVPRHQSSYQHNNGSSFNSSDYYSKDSLIVLPPRTTPSLSAMTGQEAAQYLKTGEIPTHLPQTYPEVYDNSDPMDVDEAPVHPPSEHRAFRILPALQRNTNLFSEAPVTDQEPVIWYKVPQQPTTPAQRLCNPPNQPRLRVTSQEVKENFFNNYGRRGAELNAEGTFTNGKVRHEVEFAQQTFFPPSPPNEADNSLTDLFTSFSLKTSNDEVPSRRAENLSRRQHLCQAFVLLLGIFLWNLSSTRLMEQSRNVMLLVMTSCICIGVRTVLDNTVLIQRAGKAGIVRSTGAVAGGIECGTAIYTMSEVLAGKGGSTNCASVGTILLGVMFLQDLWYISFGH